MLLLFVLVLIVICIYYASNIHRKAKEPFATYDAIYSELYDAVWDDQDRYKAEIEYISKNTRSTPLSILDLACGTGNHLKHWAKKWPRASVMGMDVSDHQLSKAREKHPDLNLVQGDYLHRENFRKETFDLIACLYGAAQYTDNMKTLFLNVFHWLKPGGTFIFHGIDASRLCDGCNQLASNTDLPFRTNDKGHCVVLYPNLVYTSWWSTSNSSHWARYNEVFMKTYDNNWPFNWDISKHVDTNVPIGSMMHPTVKNLMTNSHRLYLLNPSTIQQIGHDVGFRKAEKNPSNEIHLISNQGSEEYFIFFEK